MEVVKMFVELVKGFENGTIKYLKNSKSCMDIKKVSLVDGEIVIETELFEMFIGSYNMHMYEVQGESIGLKK